MPEVPTKPLPALKRLDVLCYLAVWMGGLSLLLVPEAPPQVIVAFCLFIAPSLFLSFPVRAKSIYRSSWHGITVLFIVLTLLDWYYNGRPLRQTLIAQMCFFQIYKAYNNKTYSDYMQMILFAVLMVVFCGLVTSSILFLVVLVPFVVLLGALLEVLNLSRQYLSPNVKRPGGEDVEITPFPAFQIAAKDLKPNSVRLPRGGLFIQALVVFAIASALFYVLPRRHVYAPSYFSAGDKPGGRHPVVSGLSGGLSLRHFSVIKSDPRPVLRVTFPSKVPPRDSIYLRAGALERLVDFEWYGGVSRPDVLRADKNGVYWLEKVKPSQLPLLIPHEVEFLTASRQLPVALPGLVAIDRVDVRAPERRFGVVGRFPLLRKYRALSWGLDDSQGRRPVLPEAESVLSRCVELPAELKTRRIHRLAGDIVYGHVGNLDCARAIEQYLRSRYSYSLNVEQLNGPANGPNPIELFLFRYKQANCEVFASAMTVLCRNLRIPARIAIGYHGGIQGDAPNVFIFRNQDAHAWVEIWSSARGWVTFDPTPPPPLGVYPGRFSFKKLMDWFNGATSRWNRLVVWYDSETKNRWMSYLWEPLDRWLVGTRMDTAFLGRLGARIRENFGRPQVLALLAALLAFNAAAAALYVEGRRYLRRRRRELHRRRVDPWFRFYHSVVDAMNGRIEARRPAQTPAEFLFALARRRFADLEPLRSALDFYHRGRFGDVPWTDETEQEAERILCRLSDVPPQ